MMHILRSLGSTFTTCACGEKVKDCAIQMIERFVDGADTTMDVDREGDLMRVDGTFPSFPPFPTFPDIRPQIGSRVRLRQEKLCECHQSAPSVREHRGDGVNPSAIFDTADGQKGMRQEREPMGRPGRWTTGMPP